MLQLDIPDYNDVSVKNSVEPRLSYFLDAANEEIPALTPWGAALLGPGLAWLALRRARRRARP